MFIRNVILFASIALTLFFFLYGFNHYYLLHAARRYRTPGLRPNPMAKKPRIAVHLPVYNEKYVIPRLVSACARMAEVYEIELVRIVIIDDSDDDTVEVIDREVASYQAQGYPVEVQRRFSRWGYKAGALQAALDRTEEEFIAVFDADFVPPEDFLVRCIPYFLQDEWLGIIQGRWTHINRNYSALTGAIATGIDVHFLIEQTGRYAAGCLQNFNGSSGILRTKALRQAGGWQADTLAEDLDASYRIQMHGYHILYLRDLHSPGEVPPTVPSYKRQQGRWACGSLQTAKKLLPGLLPDRKFGLKQRLEAFIHLTSYLVHPLMFSSFLLACLATILRVDVFRVSIVLLKLSNNVAANMENVAASLSPRYLMWGLAGLMILLCTIAAWIPPWVAMKTLPQPWWAKLASFAILFFLGCGVSLNNTIEAGKALLPNRSWAFRRTPKYAIQYGQDKWHDKNYQVSLDFISLVELAFIFLGVLSIGISLANSNYSILLILVPFTAAYGFVFSLTILQSRQGI